MSKLSDLLKSVVKEDKVLDRYLMSRGVNPLHVTKDTKVSHAKSGEFLKWKNDHVNMKEDVDKKDAITMDIPLLIRVLELAREDLKSDMDLHKVVEKLINIRDKGILTMADYDYVAHIKEQVEQMDEVLTKSTTAGETIHDFVHSDNSKFKGKSKNKRIQMALGAYYAKQHEEVEMQENKKEFSKSARIIKNIYKKQRVVKEEMYDHEKEDKSVKSPGKKNNDEQDEKRNAAAVLSGGKTMTGSKRDTVEIDPRMRLRPGQPDPTKKPQQKETA